MSNKARILRELPKAGPAYWGAAKTSFRKPGADAQIPSLAFGVNALAFEPERLHAYRDICGFDEQGIPISYPQVMAASLQIHLMSQEGFPFPLLGLVHVKNHIEQDFVLDPEQVHDVVVRTGESRRVRAGIEFELITEFARPDELPCWRAVTTIIHRQKSSSERGPRQRPEVQASAEIGRYHAIDVPADIGRRYGRIAGDVNPIHLSALSAKLFGFKRAIAHGMWSLARSAAIVSPLLDGPPATLNVSFKKPLFLPGKVALKHAGGGDKVEFSLLGERSSTVHLVGSMGAATT